MAMYSSDADLLFRRPDITNLGVLDFSEYHAAAGIMIERYVAANWYQQNAIERGIDPTVDKYNPNNLQDQNQFTDSSVYLVLSLIYEAFRKNVVEDGFSTLTKEYMDKYNKEIRIVVAMGIDYDWTLVENAVAKQPRTLHRG